MSIREEEIHLRDYLRVISKRRGLVAVFFVVTFVITALGTFTATPVYEGAVKVLIEKVEASQLTGYRYSNWDPEFYETQFQLIQSQAVGRRVVEILSLEKNYDKYMGIEEETSFVAPVKDWCLRVAGAMLTAVGAVGEKAVVADGIPRAEESPADALAKVITSGLNVSPVKDSHIVTIGYRSTHPEFAALVANTVARAYMEETLNMKMEATRRTLDWMNKKAEEERSKLTGKEQTMQAFMRSNDIVTVEDRITLLPQKLAELSTELVRAETKRKEMEALHRKVREVSKDPDAALAIPAIASNPALQTLRSQVLKAEQDLVELQGKFGPKHPAMLKAQADLAGLNEKKLVEIKLLAESIRNSYELALSQESSIREQLDRTKSDALNLNESYIQYGALKREVDTNRQIFDALMMKMKEQSITEEHQPVNLWLVEKAAVPESPVKPRKAVNLLLGLVVGLFGGIGLAFFLEYLDNTIKFAAETESILGKPVLGTIAHCEAELGSPEQIVQNQPLSPLAESYKNLRTSLLLSSADSPPNRLLVTSTNSGEGKTTTAVNLAVAMAQSGKKVLLIDADMRKPRLHKIYALDNTKGLSTHLAGVTVEDFVQASGVENLSVFTAGPIPPNPSELLISERLATLLRGFQERFDVVICDSPPVMPVTDARILSHLFEGTLLVCRAKKTTYEAAQKTLRILETVNAPVLGVVINGLDLRKVGYYYYQQYYQAYGETEV